MVCSWSFFKTKPITALALYLFFLPFFLLGCWHLGRGLGQIIQSHKRQVNFDEAVKLMGQWFVKNQTPQGDFLYELDISTGKPLESYNIVRQAGSLYSLAQLYSYAHDQQVKTAIHQGFAFFEQLSQPQSPQTTAIVYQDTKKSNASALLLLALIEYLETNPEDRDQYFSWTQELAQYLLTTQKENGGFIYKPEISQEESAYNNGESFYALIKMYHLDPQLEYLEAVNRAADYLLKAYPADNQNYSFYAWGMAGFAHLYRIDPQEKYWEYLKNSTY